MPVNSSNGGTCEKLEQLHVEKDGLGKFWERQRAFKRKNIIVL